MPIHLALILALAVVGADKPAQPALPPGVPVLDRATPDQVFKLAYADLIANVPADSRTYTRYLSLHAVPPDDRPKYVKALTLATKSTAWRVNPGHFTVTGNGLLIRLDLREYAWDRDSRSFRLAELEKRGINFGFKGDDRRLALDPWELFARDDPFFRVSQVYHGKAYVGWIDPAIEQAARLASYSTKFIVRGDWLLPRLMTEKGFDRVSGFYSTLLLFPPNERDLYKVMGVDIALVDRDTLTRRGGAIVKSEAVALHNRELQMIRSQIGLHDSWIWRTFDFDKDERGNKSVLEFLGGTVKHQGREIIGTMPSGLLWWYICDGGTGKSDGKAVAVVPESIAQIKLPLLPVRETRVVSGYGCLNCHLDGVNAFEDVVAKLIVNPKVELRVIADEKNKAKAAQLSEFLNDYYLSDLPRTVELQQASYATTLFKHTGMTGLEAATLVVGLTEDYIHELVTPEAAARAMGVTLEQARAAWVVSSRNSLLIALSGGQPITVGQWEQSFADAMTAVPTGY